MTTNTRRRTDSRSAKPATIHAFLTGVHLRAGAPARPPRRASSATDDLQVDVLERRPHDAHAVDLLARVDELAHDPWDLLARRLREAAHAAAGLDLDAAR